VVIKSTLARLRKACEPSKSTGCLRGGDRPTASNIDPKSICCGMQGRTGEVLLKSG